jgi:hypothetical protein
MTDDPDNLVLTMLRNLDTKVDRVIADMAELRTDVRSHTRTLNILVQDTRLTRAAMNDVARESVTPGEVEAIHHDLNRAMQELAMLAARLEIVEGRDRH